jgi:hypothetical protein
VRERERERERDRERQRERRENIMHTKTFLYHESKIVPRVREHLALTYK